MDAKKTSDLFEPDPFVPKAAEESALDIGPRGNRRDAFFARPEWRLDRTRSHVIDPPLHLVRWHRMT